MVFVATIDAHLIALDRQDGKKIWDIKLTAPGASITEDQKSLDPNDPFAKVEVAGSTGVAAVMAPLVYKGLVIVGITGVGYSLHLESDRPGAPLGAVVGIAGRYGRPGFIAAYRAQTGEKVWQSDTTQQGWEGRFAAATAYGVPLPRDAAAEKADASSTARTYCRPRTTSPPSRITCSNVRKSRTGVSFRRSNYRTAAAFVGSRRRTSRLSAGPLQPRVASSSRAKARANSPHSMPHQPSASGTFIAALASMRPPSATRSANDNSLRLQPVEARFGDTHRATP